MQAEMLHSHGGTQFCETTMGVSAIMFVPRGAITSYLPL